MERIYITGLKLYAFHGVNPEERQQGQFFLLDMVLEAELSRACQSDALEDTVNYAQVIKHAARAFAQPCSLIERAAEVTAQAVLEQFPAVTGITLRVHKPDAPVKAEVSDIAFELYRKQSAPTGEGTPAAEP